MSIDRIRRKNGDAWRSRVNLPNGKRKSKCFKRKADAEQWEMRLRLEGLNSSELKRKQMKFEELCEKVLQTSRSELAVGTYEKYEGAIRIYMLPHFGGYWLEDINRLKIEEFKSWLLNVDRSPSTKRFVFASLKTLFRKAMDWELINKNPAQSVKVPRGGVPRREYWSQSEAEGFLASTRNNPRYSLYFIALSTGMRLGEILGLRWDVVDLTHSLINVRRTLDQKTGQVKETTKTHKERSIRMSHPLQSFLLRLHSTKKSEFVLEREEMGCRDASHMAREFRADCDRAGIRPIRFHDIRHTFATLFVSKGGSIHALSNILGHTTQAMTERYAHYTREHAQAASELVSFTDSEDSVVVPLERARSARASGHKLVTKS